MTTTTRDRVIKAQDRVEETAADLLNAAEHWGLSNRSLWEVRSDRVRLLRCARSYARAADRLSRARK